MGKTISGLEVITIGFIIMDNIIEVIKIYDKFIILILINGCQKIRAN
jgi:hypothetical protein